LEAALQSEQNLVESERANAAHLSAEIVRLGGLVAEAEQQTKFLESEVQTAKWALHEQEAANASIERDRDRVQRAHDQDGRRVRRITQRLERSFAYWADREKPQLSGEADPFDLGEVGPMINRLEDLQLSISERLSNVEAVWRDYGDDVVNRLRDQCDALDDEVSRLSRDVSELRSERDKTEMDLSQLRIEINDEIRRAQRQSRKGVEIGLSEKFSRLLYLSDQEVDVFLVLVETSEQLEILLARCRASRKHSSLEPLFESLLQQITSTKGKYRIEPFTLSAGTEVTLQHRRHIEVVSRKGWGTRSEVPEAFRPGIVKESGRPGYWIQGDGEPVIIRKAEVILEKA
ncbi:MAG: hypothetical protein AAF236_15585, partial [Verrucomicrobiota bacterium]